MAEPHVTSSLTASEITEPTKKCTSVVWNYFGVKKDDEDSIICRKCRRPDTAKNGNTSNLLAHLKLNHPLIHQECRQAMEIKAAASGETQSKQLPVRSVAQPTLKEAIVQSQPYDTKGKKFVELTKFITYCITKDSLPVRTVE